MCGTKLLIWINVRDHILHLDECIGPILYFNDTPSPVLLDMPGIPSRGGGLRADCLGAYIDRRVFNSYREQRQTTICLRMCLLALLFLPICSRFQPICTWRIWRRPSYLKDWLFGEEHVSSINWKVFKAAHHLCRFGCHGYKMYLLSIGKYLIK